MKPSVPLLAAAFAATILPAASALDQVKTTERMVAGTITSVTALAVKVEQNNQVRELPANQIEYVSYEGEPNVLKTARSNVSTGRYEDALAALADLDTATIKRPEVVQDVEFYKAYSLAQMALVGNGDIAEAGSKMFAFVKAHPTSFHYFEAQLLVGQLAMALGNANAAANVYKLVGQNAPWPDYKARAAVALGRSHLAQNQIDEASAAFQAALEIQDASAAVQQAKLAATLGQARCLAATGQIDQASTMIEDVIKQSAPEDARLLAEAYNAL
ncbi:MAG: hypothetical protein QM844_08880, partial [Planctomycetota bacterium]|nr:hypothetical protein [Planctomycetota bacterium]